MTALGGLGLIGIQSVSTAAWSTMNLVPAPSS